MEKIGITGQAGFIGTHLFNFFGLKKDEVIRIPFEDNYFNDSTSLENFVKQCDVIIHLAALNRHNDPQTIYDTNILLVDKLIRAIEKTGVKPHVLFASSTQEERDNMFGRSKREGREMLAKWAGKNNILFTGLVIPNVYGPFGHPYYNSVVATFCHQVTHHEQPRIEIDARLKLIYIGELVEIIWKAIKDKSAAKEYKIPHTTESNVSVLLDIIQRFKKKYADEGIFPELNNSFELNLFNTFRCYMDIPGHYPVKLELKTDDRGSFVETIKSGLGGQVSFSTTKPGITRGNHFHTRKIERFAVIKGKARIQLRRIGTSEVINFDLDGSEPSYVDMPVWYTHNITNIGDSELYTFFWINEFYDPNDPDTFFEEV
ncbi:MAG: NAD-dependent epimerase/dehydratase family protein [Bacteroidales bacterium]|nr:NAD-dependent epimerase/dehydratase family protein [Bacteroidales bacterium]